MSDRPRLEFYDPANPKLHLFLASAAAFDFAACVLCVVMFHAMTNVGFGVMMIGVFVFEVRRFRKTRRALR